MNVIYEDISIIVFEIDGIIITIHKEDILNYFKRCGPVDFVIGYYVEEKFGDWSILNVLSDGFYGKQIIKYMLDRMMLPR